MEREMKVGTAIVFVDENRVEHPALVTRTWTSVGNKPGVNLVFVVDDESKTDNYGRQIDRRTSIVHLSQQPALASCWKWPDE